VPIQKVSIHSASNNKATTLHTERQRTADHKRIKYRLASTEQRQTPQAIKRVGTLIAGFYRAYSGLIV